MQHIKLGDGENAVIRTNLIQSICQGTGSYRSRILCDNDVVISSTLSIQEVYEKMREAVDSNPLIDLGTMTIRLSDIINMSEFSDNTRVCYSVAGKVETIAVPLSHEEVKKRLNVK